MDGFEVMALEWLRFQCGAEELLCESSDGTGKSLYKVVALCCVQKGIGGATRRKDNWDGEVGRRFRAMRCWAMRGEAG